MRTHIMRAVIYDSTERINENLTAFLHLRARLDDNKRIMVLATHNCDDGDGWGREGENEDDYHLFS